MPVRSLNTSVHKWPPAERVLRETQAWCEALAEAYPQILRIGLFGSYARGEEGVGSDLDLIIVVRDDARPFERRVLGDSTRLPLGADVLIYTLPEWRELMDRQSRFARVLKDEVRWLVP